MDFEIKIMTPAERSYCYTGSQQLDKQTGCIGHLRGDMDRSGNGFFTSWEDHCGELKTQAFKDEFDDFINALRFDERYDGIFKNRSSLSRYCYEHKESVFAEDFIPQYGFRVDTPEYAYLLRLNSMQGDYNLYIYCYRREMLKQHMEKAARGICFLDASGKERFRIPDGDSIRVTRPDGSHYCYKLGIFPKGRPQNRARLHFLLREDLLKLNNISQEVRLLARHQIDTAEQLALYKKEQEVNIRELSAKRRVLQNALRTKAVRDSPKQADAHRAQIRELSERLKALRREVHLCDDIAERSGVMAEKLKAVREDAQKQRQKEEQQHEHIRRRS